MAARTVGHSVGGGNREMERSRPIISNKIINIVKRSSQIIIIIIVSNVVICTGI